MGKIIVVMFLVFIGLVGVLWYHTQVDDLSETVGATSDGEKPGGAIGAINDAADVFTGAPQMQALDKAKAGATKADLRTYQTAITMFYTQNNRFPKDLEELYQSNMIGADALKDPWGQPFRSEVKDNKLIIYSSGKSKIAKTSDDIWAEIPLQ